MRRNILSFFKSYKLYLVIALVIGIFIRLYGLSIQSFWYDELFSVTASSLSPGEMFGWLLKDVHPPLYYVFLHYWMSIFGFSEAIVRLPCAIAGVLTIFFTYYLTRKVFDKYIATSATILMALSDNAIMFSQEARMYSFLLLTSTITTLMWLNFVKREEKDNISKLELFLYGITCIITAYLHYFGTILIFFQLLYLLLFREYRKKILALGIVILLAFLPWFIPHFFIVIHSSSRLSWIDKSNLGSLMTLINYIYNKKLILLLLLPIILKPGIIISKIKSLNIGSPVTGLLYIAFIPVIAVFIAGLFANIFYHRYFIIIFPAVYLLISVLISLNPIFSKQKGNAYVLAVSMISLSLLLTTFYKPYKQPWREASQYILGEYTDNSVIFTNVNRKVYLYYFNRFYRKSYPLYIDYLDSDLDQEQIAKVKNRFSKIFFFYSYSKLSPEGEMDLKQSCSSFKENYDFPAISLYECAFDKQK